MPGALVLVVRWRAEGLGGRVGAFCTGQPAVSVVNCRRMKRQLLFTLFAVAVTLTACRTASDRSASRPIELFNGRNLAGWTHVLEKPDVPREAVWSVRDRILICAGKPLGVLQTEREFTSFRLVVEYRWAPGTKPGNSGILTRINGPARALPRSAEVQLMHGNAGDVLGLQGMRVLGGQPRSFEVKAHAVAGDISGVRKLVDAEKPPGEWNRIEVLADGGSYTVWMNGQQINHAVGVEILPGPIGLQSEGGEIHFRRVTLTPLVH